MPRIHPTAIVNEAATLADDVEVGPYAIIEADVSIGPGTRIGEHAVIRRYTTLGAGNVIDAHVTLGGLPQDYKFVPLAKTYLRIGDGNTFREGVTISRATGEGNATVVGNRTYWMTASHAGHNAVIEDECVLVNGAAMAGHTVLGRGAILSAHVVIHQFCWVGERVMTQGLSGASMHIPPYSLTGFGINNLIGLNVVGMRRATDLTNEDRRQIKEAFRLLYRSGLTPAKALEKMDACEDWGAPAGRYRDFVRRVLTATKPYDRGVCHLRRHQEDSDESEWAVKTPPQTT
ncbi:MAG: acyl-ACP--UDP-N-acetylglucosamine O-acyltransferase [Phycisphaerae bacterium]